MKDILLAGLATKKYLQESQNNSNKKYGNLGGGSLMAAGAIGGGSLAYPVGEKLGSIAQEKLYRAWVTKAFANAHKKPYDEVKSIVDYVPKKIIEYMLKDGAKGGTAETIYNIGKHLKEHGGKYGAVAGGLLGAGMTKNIYDMIKNRQKK